MFKAIHFGIWTLLMLLYGCTASQNIPAEGGAQNDRSLPLKTYTVEPQQAPPEYIQSVQLYKKGNEQNAPVIRLNSSDKLVLEFDALGSESRQFKLTVSHRNQDWTESGLPPDFYLGGFHETYIQDSKSSFSRRPPYRHYSFEFPGTQFTFKASGNYLLLISDYRTDELLFSLPFFVHEDEGDLDSRIERLFAQREDLRAEDQLFSSYRYPDFVDFPQFDLSFAYAQNQFWGRIKTVQNYDTSSPETVHFHLGREDAFLSNYEFNTIDLRQVTADGHRILEVQNETTPPAVILRRDVQAFTVAPRFFPDTRFGLPLDDRNASYFNVHFRLETTERLTNSQKVYLVGDFNNWTVNRLNRMHYNNSTGLWEGTALIKEGHYAYKYVLLRNGQIDDLTLDQGFLNQRQLYTTFVYFRDPSRNYDRLLQVHQIGN